MGSPTEGPNATVRIRPAHQVSRFVAPSSLLPAFHPPSTALRGPIGSPTESPSLPSACFPNTQYSA
eukprot:5777866-Pyramimonas_sp.AAC.1